MCLSALTPVPLADGRDHPIDELCRAQHIGYSCTPSGRVVMGCCSGEAAQMSACVRITLDSGEQVSCSSLQELLLRDGSYCRAGQLAAGASLMPYYSKRDK